MMIDGIKYANINSYLHRNILLYGMCEYPMVIRVTLQPDSTTTRTRPSRAALAVNYVTETKLPTCRNRICAYLSMS